MFLRCKSRRKDGKEHRSWSLVENRRVGGGRVVQRQVLYLGEINDSQQAAWRRTIEVFAEGQARPRQMALFPEDRALPGTCAVSEVVQVRLGDLQLCRARQWGGCWLACQLWDQLGLEGFWSERLPASRKGTRWLNVLKTLVVYRLLDPGSEWRLHRQWFDASAMGDLLGEDPGLVQADKLYRCLDKLLAHKADFFTALKARWQSLFAIEFDVLLYDLTSTYFESPPPGAPGGKRRFGYVRQSTADQVAHNLESQRRQYGLTERARKLGWTEVSVIDNDFCRSGSGVSRPEPGCAFPGRLSSLTSATLAAPARCLTPEPPPQRRLRDLWSVPWPGSYPHIRHRRLGRTRVRPGLIKWKGEAQPIPTVSHPVPWTQVCPHDSSRRA